ncbi:MAG: EAL domain-containing protein [Pseudomonadota bacterium]
MTQTSIAQLGAAHGLLSAQCLMALARLPGVVVYQRVVTSDEKIFYTYISDGCRDIFGVAPEQILSDPEALFGRHSEEYKAKFRERLIAASKALTVWDVEASIDSADGSKKYTHAIARPERQPDGSTLWTGIILDETRTREAVIEGLSQGFLLYGPDDRLIMRNSHFLEIFPELRDSAVPGAHYEDVMRAEMACGTNAPTDNLEPTVEFCLRLEGHRAPSNMLECQIGPSKWVLINENRTRDGGTVIVYTDISELKCREREIRFLADHDILTGVYNRTAFHRRAEEAIANARLRGSMAAVMCLDIDHFKNINDTYGHPAGDEVLKVITKRLCDCFREMDTVARFGGDELGIVFADAKSPDTVATVASRLLQAISQPIDFNGQKIACSASIGVAVSSDGDTADKVIGNADLALYRAKADGRDAFCFFEQSMDTLVHARRALGGDLRQAVANEQLELHYQPQIDIFTDEIVGVEALVRWRHPERGMISPADFIPVAEETGVIGRIGEWVLRRACTDALAWPEAVKVAVNLSPAQFKHRNLAQSIAKTLEDTGLSPSRLELEITESVLLQDSGDNKAVLRMLKDLGVRVSIDDFGTGYSCLATLRSFPFDKIKIDQSFVCDLEQNPDSAAIIHAVLGLGHSLGMSTCAEGVETAGQLAFLRSEGCTEVQGYYYSKPKPLAEITRMLEQRTLSPTANEQAKVA